MSAFLLCGHGGYRVDPGQGGTVPDLLRRAQLRALGDGADAQRINGWIFRCTGGNRRAAVAAEHVSALAPAFCRLDVTLRVTAQQPERFRWGRYIGAKSGSADGLAIGTVADADGVGIDRRLERNCPTMTLSVDLHGNSSSSDGRQREACPRTKYTMFLQVTQGKGRLSDT